MPRGSEKVTLEDQGTQKSRGSFKGPFKGSIGFFKGIIRVPLRDL